MCGIVGVITKAQNGFTNKEISTFKQLLYVDALRGEDSTGVVAFYNNGVIDVAKECTEATVFMYNTEFEAIIKESWSHAKALMGHNRKKTIGSIKDETAHPFIIDDRYVFMHNGTLNSWKHLADTEVDSEALGRVLTKCDGDVAKIAKELERVSGAYATAWVDQVKEELYLLRNKERPLFYAVCDTGIVYASEAGFIMALASRNGIKIEKLEEVAVDTLHRFDLSKFGCDLKKESFEIKKAPPSFTGGTLVNGTATFTKRVPGETDGLSKNAFKKNRPNYGEIIQFYAEDYIPKFVESEDTGDWILLGESEHLPRNFIRGDYGNFSEAYIKNHCLGYLFCGRVNSVTYDKASGGAMIIYVENVQPVARSNKHLAVGYTNEETTSRQH